MGEFKSGIWIIGILIYYVAFFSIVGATSSTNSIITNEQRQFSYTDPGFQEQFNTFNVTGECSGRSDAITFFGNIKCNKLGLNEYQEECNLTQGCLWYNYTSLFGFTVSPQECKGNVNKSYYALSGAYSFDKSSGICESAGNNETLCRLIKCVWVNPQQMAEESNDDFQSTNFLTTLWDSIKFVVLFSVDFGLGSFNWLISFIFFYLPFMFLLYCLYMALPFLH